MKTLLLKTAKLQGVLLIVYLLFSCSSQIISKQGQKEKFINDFFSNEKVIHNLKKYSDFKTYIYDGDHLITKSLRNINKNPDEIIIDTKIPHSKFYFLVNKFVLNNDLAFVVLETNDNSKGVVFYLLKDKGDGKWYVMNIEHRNAK